MDTTKHGSMDARDLMWYAIFTITIALMGAISVGTFSFIMSQQYAAFAGDTATQKAED